MKVASEKKSECKCESCVRACHYTPGWFLPGEAEKAAKLLGLTLKKFFDKYLVVNWWVGDDPVFVLAPAITTNEPGDMADVRQIGTCVFFKEGLCGIHSAKPYECAMYRHGKDSEVPKRHERVADAWRAHQDQPEKLLGREPYADEGTIFDMLGLGFF